METNTIPPGSVAVRYICAVCGNEGVVMADRLGMEMMPDLLRLKIQCDACSDRHNPPPRPRHDLVAEQIERWVPTEYRVSDPNKFPPEQFKNCQWWTPGKRGLFLYGPSRRCKSRIAYWIAMRQLTLRHGVEAHDCRTFRGTVEERIRDGTLWKWYEELKTTPVLLLDDLGKFRGDNKRIEEELFNVVKLRVESEQGMIITSNMALPELAHQFSENIGEPLVSRIRESCMLVNFYTPEEQKVRPTMQLFRQVDL